MIQVKQHIIIGEETDKAKYAENQFRRQLLKKRVLQKRTEIIMIELLLILFIGRKFRYIIKREAVTQDIQYHIQCMCSDRLICFKPLYLRPAYAVVGI